MRLTKRVIKAAGRVHVAGLGALSGYGWLALRSGDLEARPWLGLALVVGWGALAAVGWGQADSRAARWAVVGWAVAFRMVGLGTSPSWEDDYHRYLWDGYQLVTTGNPYAKAPEDAFGASDDLPEAVAAALDGVNHPELPTIYGPVAEAVFGLAAGMGLGRLGVLKLLLVGAELVGWWSLRAVLGWRGWVLVWWCPLAVTEIAFAGHPEALGGAALALALAAWRRGAMTGAAGWTAVGMAVKPFGAVLAPFVVGRFGWKAAAVGLAVWSGCYLPFWLQGSAAEWPVVRAMAGVFEYNSTGFALLGMALPDPVARGVASALTVMGAGWIGWRWWRRPERWGDWPPAAVVLGWAWWWAPVMNPWYALWLLPLVAVRFSAWALGVLIAVPLAYTHGWGVAVGAGVDYTHPGWARPLEVAVVVVTVAVARWARREGNRGKTIDA